MSKKVQEEKYADWNNHRNIYRRIFGRSAYEYAVLQQGLAENLIIKKIIARKHNAAGQLSVKNY